MRLEISQFGGMAPLVDPTALSDERAVFAKNVRFDQGVLAPGALRLVPTGDYPDVLLSGRGVRSVSKMFEDGTRFGFTDVDGADAFPSPVSPADTWGRVYFSTAQGPSFTVRDNYTVGTVNIGMVSYRLGVPAPALSPSARATVDLDYDADAVDVAYAFAYVDKYGHEGPISSPTTNRTLAYNKEFLVELGFREDVPTRVNFDGGSRRVYRAAFDGSSSQWQFLADVPIGEASWTDTIPIGQEGESLISDSWYPAPEGLRNLCLVGSAFAAGFVDHHVCYSEQRLPHAWPFELQYPLKYAPVKLLPIRNGLLIVTSGRPYWAEGADPYSAIPQEMPLNAPCISADAVVDMGGYAMFITDEGIVAVSGGSGELVSTAYLDRAKVRELVGGSCTAFAFDGRYVFSTRDDRWLAFSPAEGLVEYDFGFPPSEFESVSFSVRDNRHYFALSDGRIRVVDFSGEALGVEWHSKHWRTPAASFSCVRVEADTYPVDLEIRSHYLGRPWESSGWQQVNGPHLARLPANVGTLWEVRVRPAAAARVYRVVLGQSGKEVA